MNEFDKTWNESFKNYAVEIARIYITKPDEIINCLHFDSVCGSLNETYLALVKENEIEPIENLDREEKEKLWSRAKQLSDKKEKRIIISRAIYLLEKLTS